MPDASTHLSEDPLKSGEGLPGVNPDFAGEEAADIDNIIPTRGYDMLPIVALGGSAGSFGALQAFFQSLQPNSGAAYVVIVHLSPEHNSLLPEILQRAASIPVTAAEDGTKIEVDHVYVIPPGKYLLVTDGHLRLAPLEIERGKRVAVDLFFRSLADTHGPHSTAIVLSGADGDGAVGLKRIKERGGLTIAQDPEEAEYASMPRTAISTGMVDWVLPMGQIAGRIFEYYQNEGRLRLPSEDGPQPAKPVSTSPDEDEAALREVLVFLRTRTGRDFSYYKRATIVRRISRRMQVNAINTVPDYLTFLRTHPGEAGALLQDLLISVTNFFRDRESFEALEAEIPDLFAGKSPSDTVRVWVPACATGEEAYSMAILLSEHARTLSAPPLIQVFGCDLDEQAIQVARAGVFPDAITADVSEERLQRFFTREHRGFRVRREIREVVLFATHDLLKDAPFSRMDLISCRNLLIYLNHEAQNRVFEIFHFAMRPGARLFLGSSESVEDGSPLFTPKNKKQRIYLQKPAPKAGLPVPSGSGTLLRVVEKRDIRDSTLVHGRSFGQSASLLQETLASQEDRISLGELHFKLLERFAPPSIVVDEHHNIVHLSENAGAFLQFIGGETTVNLLRVVNPALRVDLRATLFRAAETSALAETLDLPMEIQGETRVVDIRVSPATEFAPGYLLVIFDSRRANQGIETPVPRLETDPAARQLERELERVKTHLRDTVEQYEAGTEELKASNEELQAMNEELRSATEELETSREELQSINEELTTVNQELKVKVDELGQVNSDLHNLMSSTAIATVFLDRSLRIMRYTPAAVSLFHLIPTDIGRPLADLKYRMDYPELLADSERVLGALVPVEREIGSTDDSWFMARLLPYRTIDDHIAGVVLTFVDVSERKRAEELLRGRNEELERFNRVVIDREMRMVELKKEANALAERLGEAKRYDLDSDLEEEKEDVDP